MNTAPEKIKQSFKRSFGQYHKAAIVQAEIADRLAKAFQEIAEKDIPRLFEFGAATGHLTEALLKNCQIETYIANDLVGEAEKYLTRFFEEEKTRFQFLKGDIETLSLPQNLNVIASASTLQWVQNSKVLFKNCHQALSKNGFLVLSSFTPYHFYELQAFNPTSQMLSYLDKNTLEELLQEDFEVLKIWQEERVLEFDKPRDVLRHLRQTGVNANASHHWTKQKLRRFEETYKAEFGKKDKVSLTYAPIYVIAQKR